MTAPALTVQIQGQGTVSADMINTFEQTCDDAADLRAFVGTLGIQVYIRGLVTPGDGGQGVFYWNPSATGPDDGTSVIIPPAAGAGGWIRLSADSSGSAGSSVIPCTATGTNAIVLTPIAGTLPFSAYANYQLFSFVPANTTTGTVTINVAGIQPRPAYLQDGVTPAGANAFLAGVPYVVIYASNLNGNAGGFMQLNALTALKLTAPPVFLSGGYLSTVLSSTAAASTSGPEAALMATMSASVSSGTSGPNSSKAAIIATTTGHVGTGNATGIIVAVGMDASVGTSTMNGVVIDMVNSNQNYDTLGGSAAAYGTKTLADGTLRITAAHYVGTTGTAQANYGVALDAGSIRTAGFYDGSSSTTGFMLAGTHSYGLDMQGATISTNAIRIPNNTQIVARNAANSLDFNLIHSDSTNNIEIGDTNAAAVFIGSAGALAPVIDGALAGGISCGQNGNRWTAVWAVNGTIQTSDPAMKRDKRLLPNDCLGLVTWLTPWTWEWSHDGEDAPRHWGFMAPDVKAAFATRGWAFGGVTDDSLAYHELIPVLWKAVQELTGELRRYKGGLA